MQQYPEEIQNNEEEPVTFDSEDAEGLVQALADEKKKAEEYLAGLQRSQADFINYKRRTEHERQELSRFAAGNLILELLPVLDDLELALNAMPPDLAEHDWVEGVRLVERKFRTIIEGKGVTPMETLGEPFDPNFHEALRQGAGEEGIVIEEFQKGYMLGDKVLRPARVVVGNGEEEEKEDL